jgi:hypothetical protein
MKKIKVWLFPKLKGFIKDITKTTNKTEILVRVLGIKNFFFIANSNIKGINNIKGSMDNVWLNAPYGYSGG